MSYDAIYMISEIESDKVRKFLGENFKHVYWKHDIEQDIWEKYPFEILAQIDFEVGNLLTKLSDGTYFSQKGSSSDNFMESRREVDGSKTVTYNVANKGRGLLCDGYG